MGRGGPHHSASFLQDGIYVRWRSVTGVSLESLLVISLLCFSACSRIAGSSDTPVKTDKTERKSLIGDSRWKASYIDQIGTFFADGDGNEVEAVLL
jgi:hypothetical protein